MLHFQDFEIKMDAEMRLVYRRQLEENDKHEKEGVKQDFSKEKYESKLY